MFNQHTNLYQTQNKYIILTVYGSLQSMYAYSVYVYKNHVSLLKVNKKVISIINQNIRNFTDRESNTSILQTEL